MKNLGPGTWQYIMYAINDGSYSILFIFYQLKEKS